MDFSGYTLVEWLPVIIAVVGLGGCLLVAAFGPKGRPGGRG